MDLTQLKIEDWVNIAVIAAAIITAVALAYRLVFDWRSRKSRAIRAEERFTRLTPKSEHEKVSISFNGEHVLDLHVVLIRLWNAGRDPITREDFDAEYIEVRFSEPSNVLEAEILNTSSPLITPQVQRVLSKDGSCDNVRIGRFLFNPKDHVTVRFFVSGYEYLPRVFARVKGVQEIKVEPVDEFQRTFKMMRQYLPLLMMICLFLGVMGSARFGLPKNPLDWVALFFGLVLFGVGMNLLAKYMEKYTEVFSGKY